MLETSSHGQSAHRLDANQSLQAICPEILLSALDSNRSLRHSSSQFTSSKNLSRAFGGATTTKVTGKMLFLHSVLPQTDSAANLLGAQSRKESLEEMQFLIGISGK
jgi:hypothetical protein